MLFAIFTVFHEKSEPTMRHAFYQNILNPFAKSLIRKLYIVQYVIIDQMGLLRDLYI